MNAAAAPVRALWAEDALLPEGWARAVLLQWDAAGQLTQVGRGLPAPPGVARAAGPLLPGMPNLHSHAFQRALAGLAEFRGAQADSFWSWRERMYAFATRITPEALEAIATWLYLEMLEAGYTSVCEFHYLHHGIGGKPYADDATLSLALLRTAARVGIGITLLPVLYQTGNFGAPPLPEQARFLRSTDDLLALLQRLAPIARAQGAALGLAPHSLRAVPRESLRAGVAGLHALLPHAPVHIHIAEQVREVRDCLAWSGQTPVQWLLDHAPVDARWCLVHATHMTPGESAGAARSGAVAGLCPSTEANLGDGIFDLPQWRAHGGRWGIGSDSQVCVNAAEELMLLEYSQRLQRGERNVLGTDAQPQVATAMLLQAVAGGARACGRPVAGLCAGQQADFVVLDARHVALCGLPAESALAGHVFASQRSSAVHAVWVAGKPRVQSGGHALRAGAQAAFVHARRELLGGAAQ
ncbi:formimidoylglutamate deiminase [Comamonas antarctica]|uniref:Formimidoylglutamate deiminase n=1 Tax=Comamonas antarctica TaxID=2743470 RepID=A0A6N1X5V0_9BURK|nr:formimidoylglutamate deiminase [Comamonas antarctica]QKV53673.1 formimidoylglutamate deiminase [Comamonas antarctica]